MLGISVEAEMELERAQEAVKANRDNLLAEGVGALLLIQATFHHGIAIPLIEHLDDEEQLMVCDMLEDFISDTKALIVRFRN